MKLVLIPAGKLLMGSPKNEKGRLDHEGQQEVEIATPFYLGVYTVTQAEYKRIMGNNPSWFSATGGGKDKVAGHGHQPVSRGTCFIGGGSGFLPQAVRVAGGERLPAESIVCRARRNGNTPAGRGRRRPFILARPFPRTRPTTTASLSMAAARKATIAERPRPWAVSGQCLWSFDMHGNVWQWCQDWYTEPLRRAVRGGCWRSYGAALPVGVP